MNVIKRAYEIVREEICVIELNKRTPETKIYVTKRKKREDAKRRSLYRCVVMLTILFIVISWAGYVYGATSYMEFTVIEVSASEVLVENSDGDSFWFIKPVFEVSEGLKVIIRMDLTHVTGEEWEWYVGDTKIIGREGDYDKQ